MRLSYRIFLFVLTPFVAFAKTNYVDCALEDYTGHDGSSWALAVKTIQEGVDRAAKNDTILVAAGRYDAGEGLDANEPAYTNRVFVNKEGLTIRSVAGREHTFIVGAHDPHPVDAYGNGPAAVRCVRIAADNVVIEGFTLTDGAAHPLAANQDGEHANGGGCRGYSTAATSCLVDCVVTNCTGVRGGALRFGCAVRCLFANNVSAWKAAAGNNSRFLNCVFTRNTGHGSLAVSGQMVNCTVYRNGTVTIGSEGARFYNCLCALNTTPGDLASDVNLRLRAYHSVFTRRVNDSSVSYFGVEEASVLDAPVIQYANPIFDDIRLLPDSAAVNLGEAAYLSSTYFALPARVARYCDFAGNAIPETGAIHAGALQEVAPAPKGGALQFLTAAVTVEGRRTYAPNEYVLAHASYPQQFLIAANVTAGRIYGYKRTGPGYGSGQYIFPRPDDTLYMLPPRAGLVYTNMITSAGVNRCFYVDPAKGDDQAHNGLSASTPFKTIQKAVDSTDTSYTVISCAAGDYDSEDGLQFVRGVTNRVTIPSSASVRIIGAGAGKTVIWGKYSPAAGGTDKAHYYGCGPGAIRCFCSMVNGHSAIQGVTFKRGRCAYEGTDDDTNGRIQGGGAWFQNGQQVLDCTFDDCVGYRGACFGSTSAKVLRSRFTDCYGFNGGIRYTKVYMSVLENNKFCSGNGIMLSFNSQFQHLTVIGQSDDDQPTTAVPVTNTVFARVKEIAAGWKDYGGVFASDVTTCPDAIRCDHLLADAANGNYRILSTSPAWQGGLAWDDYALEYSPDVDGRPVIFTAEGLPLPGAVQEVAQGVRLTGDGVNGVSLAGEDGYLAPGASVEITYDESQATRPVSALLVNGVEADLSTLPFKCTLTAPDADTPVTEAFTVEAVFSTNWYVNAQAENNDGNGFRPETAKRTFHGAKGVFETGYVAAGDVVHAAAGVYGEGTFTITGDTPADIANRVVVPAYVTLVADEGPEKTFIVGAAATDGSGDPMGKGRGDDAVRCVTLMNNARIRNFTITGGRTTAGDTGNGHYGGGIFSRVSRTAYAENCIISNNFAQRGGGMHNGSAVNCRFYENWAYKNRTAMSQGYMYGCLVDYNHGVNATQNTSGLWNCTFGTHNVTLDGTATTASAGMPYGAVVNCIFTDTVQIDASMASAFTNCIFRTGKITGTFTNATYIDCQTNDLEDIVLGEDYAPVIGLSSAVDAGYRDEEALARLGGTDVWGAPRIANCRLDIGAVEADWKDLYAAALGRGITVTNASSAVELVSGKVTLHDGAILSGVWRQLAADRPTVYTFAGTAGEGTLTGLVGTFPVTLTDESACFTNKANVVAQDFTFAFAGTGYARVEDFRQRVPGTMLLLR